jgi:hypothetical protein
LFAFAAAKPETMSSNSTPSVLIGYCLPWPYQRGDERMPRGITKAAFMKAREEDERVDTIPIDFCDEIPGILGEMEEAFEAGDDEGLKKFSHQLVKFLNKKN